MVLPPSPLFRSALYLCRHTLFGPQKLHQEMPSEPRFSGIPVHYDMSFCLFPDPQEVPFSWGRGLDCEGFGCRHEPSEEPPKVILQARIGNMLIGSVDG